jgi:hypothetical protein
MRKMEKFVIFLKWIDKVILCLSLLNMLEGIEVHIFPLWYHYYHGWQLVYHVQEVCKKNWRWGHISKYYNYIWKFCRRCSYFKLFQIIFFSKWGFYVLIRLKTISCQKNERILCWLSWPISCLEFVIFIIKGHATHPVKTSNCTMQHLYIVCGGQSEVQISDVNDWLGKFSPF